MLPILTSKKTFGFDGSCAESGDRFAEFFAKSLLLAIFSFFYPAAAAAEWMDGWMESSAVMFDLDRRRRTALLRTDVDG